MLTLMVVLGVILVGLVAVIVRQRRNGNKGEHPAPHAGVHDYRENRG